MVMERSKLPPTWYAIDFGTSNSLLCAASAAEVFEPIPINTGNTGDRGEDSTILKSVFYTADGKSWIFGREAIERYGESNEGRLLRSIKKFLPDPGFKGTNIFGRTYSIIDLIAIFLKHLKSKADQYYGVDVTKVVLGHPALFSTHPERHQLALQRLKGAAQQAGFKDVRYCPEPIAAAHEFKHRLLTRKLVLVADFGGGTSDFTLLRMDGSGFKDEDVLGISGISVAGDAFDGSIMKHVVCPHLGSKVSYKLPLGSNVMHLPTNLINKMCSPADMVLLGHKDIMRLLRDASRWSIEEEEQRKMDQLFVLIEENQGYSLFAAIERCKIALSEQSEAPIEFYYPGIAIEDSLSSSDFSFFSYPHANKIIRVLDEMLNACNVTYDAIDVVCCTGGTSKIRNLQAELALRFGKEKLSQFENFHSVIKGLGHYAFSCMD